MDFSDVMEPSEEIKQAKVYDIVPTVAINQTCEVYSLCSTLGMKYVFTGGSDGFVRKFDFEASINNKQPMSISQRHQHPDSITKNGVLDAFWENEQPLTKSEYKVDSDQSYKPQLSPVFALEAQKEGLWVCAGLQSGGISFQSAALGQIGQTIAYLDGHNKPVSDMALNLNETVLLSGSWDKTVNIWDLNTGIASVSYNLASQISTVEYQPQGGPSVASNEDSDSDKSMGSLFGSDEEGENDNNKEDDPEVKEETNAAKQPSAASQGTSKDTSQDTSQGKSSGNNVFMTSTFNGLVEIWDSRQQERAQVLENSPSPPWCMSSCWSYNGDKVYAGRRNNLVEEYDIRNCKEPSKLMKFPALSGQVSCVTAMPNNTSVLCACQDNIRLYDLTSQRKTPFIIIPGHHGSIVSRMVVDGSGRYMVSVCGGRGWMDAPLDIGLGYEIEPERTVE